MKIAVACLSQREMNYTNYWKNFFEGTRWRNPNTYSEIRIIKMDTSFLAEDFGCEYEIKGDYGGHWSISLNYTTKSSTIDEIADSGYMLISESDFSWYETPPTPVAIFDKGIPLGKVIIVKGLALGNDPSAIGSCVCGYNLIT